MIEAAMYLALGFCIAGLVALAILPAFYRRAARLTEEALRAVNPGSYAEVRAFQDQERARHAVEMRRVELRLQHEREKATRHHSEATVLKSELETLRANHQAELSKLGNKLASRKSARKTLDLLSTENKALKTKLEEAERAVAESWSNHDRATRSGRPQSSPDADWKPATDAVALATITGLESEIATLKAKLAQAEPSAAHDIDHERTRTAKSRLADLETQLVDTESKYISAQAEVTRLSLQLDAANIEESELQKSLTGQLERLANENARHQAILKGKGREVARLEGQIDKLKKDLDAAPALTGLRQEFRQLAAQLPGSDAQDAAGKSSKAVGQTRRTSSGDDLKPRRQQRRPGARAKQKAADASAAQTPSGPAKTAAIADAAEALVSRIIASNRPAHSKAAAKSDHSETAQAAVAPPPQESDTKPRAPGKSETAKQKSKDVA